MSAIHHYTLHCDHPETDPGGNVVNYCRQRWVGGSNAGRSRRQAAESGWVHYVLPLRRQGPAFSGDLCHLHAASLPEGATVVQYCDREEQKAS